jgi:TPR repeat protein
MFSRLFVLALLLGSGLLRAQNSLGNVVISSRPQGISVTIDLSAPLMPQAQPLTNPNRLLFDFPGFFLQGPSKRIPVNIEGVTDIRVALNSANPPLTRIGVDSSQPLNFELKPAGNRLVIELTSAAGAATTSNAARPSPSPETHVASRVAPAPVDTPRVEAPRKAPAAIGTAQLDAPSLARPSAYMLQAKARELTLEELQPLEDKAQAGDPEAETSLALAYHAGTLLKKDDAEAERWLRKAADQNFMAAEESLGIFAETGVGRSAPAGAEAIDWYKKAITHGSVDAATSIGLMYADGIGIQKDPAQAVPWFRQAAEGGDAVAQYNMALMYKRGNGVQQDDKEYIHWLTVAADQGQMKAQYDLGTMYEEGNGVPADRSLAAHYFQLAADQGMPKAQFRLGRILATSKDSSDQIAAYKFLMLAQEAVKESSPLLNDLRKAMNPQDVAEAERGVDSWRIAHR